MSHCSAMYAMHACMYVLMTFSMFIYYFDELFCFGGNSSAAAAFKICVLSKTVSRLDVTHILRLYRQLEYVWFSKL